MIASALAQPPNSARTHNAGKGARALRRLSGVTEGLIYFLIVFTPWALGTTEDWSMVVADGAAYLLGLLLIVNRIRGWRDSEANTGAGVPAHAQRGAPAGSGIGRWLTRAVALLTVALLGYVLISALNGRATYDWNTNTFAYFPCLRWLPHTYDTNSTWPAFWNYLGWAAFFWAVHDWLGTDAGTPKAQERARSLECTRAMPTRLSRLLWVLSINGGLLALEALLQQTSGTNKLLWIRETFYNRSAEAQFGPFAYRANGAAYLNLIWPVTLGFWWFLHRTFVPGQRSAKHHLLLASLLIMVVGPLVSLSRGGALVSFGSIALCGAVLALAGFRKQWVVGKWITPAVLVGAVAGGLAIAGPKLAGRMKEIGASYTQREQMSEVGRRMAADNPLFGTGPETLQPVYQLYKLSPDEFWPGQLHNDWLETRVTFGWVGVGMILAALVATLARWFAARDGIRTSWRVVSFFWISMAGCLLHARWDLPFQVYSIVLLFLLYCAILLRLARVHPGRVNAADP